MNQLFEFIPKTKIAYGVERYLQIGKDVKTMSEDTKAVLITDKGIVDIGLADLVVSALERENIDVKVFSDVQSDPTAASIDEAANVIRQFGAKCVIGLGGGSAMDVAKMAALIAGGEKGAMYYALMANPFPKKQVKSIMIPTTSGTGAEVTSTVVFSDEHKRKVWGWDEKMAPDLAIIDPTFTVALPRFLTAATTLDALVHAIEACAGKRSNPFIEAFSLQAIQLIGENFERVLQTPNDLEARGKLALAATLAGMAIEQGGTGIAHCIGHALGTIGRVHHGRAVAIALNAVYSWNIETAIDIHAKIAQCLVVNDQGLSKKELALAGAKEFSRLVEISGLKQSLEDDGLSLHDVDRFVETMLSSENEPMRLNNCRLATEKDLRQFAEQILSTNKEVSHQA
ncbi:iron-containing alcohol dehydrogenase [Anoxybacillus flavithermus]|uniref:long-chain-alcohol dehydrogenase n=1 Tax=Anoxybacillus flavithermus (strain DSM 21510 / WK1) TaxID=491915 RepID=B7GJB4_ANOFW|nr:iron-containing alcohol dehydrogenase [Anoxybacillus flavithermus]ACJ33562.1 Fe-dependent alcohol dehydrogenase, class IV [Anoxybacillus flavithermus WK1]